MHSLSGNQVSAPRLCYCCLTVPPWSWHSLPSLISSYWNRPLGTQERPRRPNEAHFLKTRNGGHRKAFLPRSPTGPCLVTLRVWDIYLFIYLFCFLGPHPRHMEVPRLGFYIVFWCGISKFNKWGKRPVSFYRIPVNQCRHSTLKNTSPLFLSVGCPQWLHPKEYSIGEKGITL